MSTDTSAVTAQQRQTADPQKAIRFQPGRGLIGLLGMLIVAWFLANLFLAFGYYPQWFGNKIVIAEGAHLQGNVAMTGGSEPSAVPRRTEES